MYMLVVLFMEVSSLLASMCGQSMTLAHTISDMHTHNVASQIPNIDYWTEKISMKLLASRKRARYRDVTMSPYVQRLRLMLFDQLISGAWVTRT